MSEVISQAAPEEMPLVRELFEEYASGLAVDLGYQGFAAELAGLPGRYAPPGGGLLLARLGDVPVGGGAVRAWAEGTCEMKRLYVRPACQGQGLGRRLAESLIAHARRIGYSRMLLDTLPTMTAALRLYASLGFVRCAAYYDCPVDGNVFLMLDLATKPEKGSSASEAVP